MVLSDYLFSPSSIQTPSKRKRDQKSYRVPWRTSFVDTLRSYVEPIWCVSFMWMWSPQYQQAIAVHWDSPCWCSCSCQSFQSKACTKQGKGINLLPTPTIGRQLSFFRLPSSPKKWKGIKTPVIITLRYSNWKPEFTFAILHHSTHPHTFFTMHIGFSWNRSRVFTMTITNKLLYELLKYYPFL